MRSGRAHLFLGSAAICSVVIVYVLSEQRSADDTGALTDVASQERFYPGGALAANTHVFEMRVDTRGATKSVVVNRADDQEGELTDHSTRTMPLRAEGPLEETIRNFQAQWEAAQPKWVQISPFSSKTLKELDQPEASQSSVPSQLNPPTTPAKNHAADGVSG